MGAAVGASFGLGIVLVVSAGYQRRSQLLARRVLPYLRDVERVFARSDASTRGSFVGARRLWNAVSGQLGEAIGSSTQVARRLDRLGSAQSVEDFRTRQAAWGGIGFAAAFVVGLLLSRQGVPLAALLVLCAVGFIGGVTWCDQQLTAEVNRHETAMREEFPIIADLLALSVAAGESPVGALERVNRVGHGVLIAELARVLADVRTGTPVAVAFDRLSTRTGVPSVARFAEAMSVAVDRGTPLVDVLHAQAADVRESSRRDLIETGGKREVLMLLPVVFLLLPLTITFAFYPGLINLNLTSGAP